ncbi:hypothetical protein GLAREA_05684 [Glarea lozoyensis ATCC 20868]|uniref:Yeast cell wall synthesis Kre9/Knh1-like N-terminal domain-containing protein n=1 Tax=Glarea lozoyensis (strain ATCC 20868 / MF5171) TaxID=1116229 RepID=S3DWP0_GLAL2|nr:uncharacterized protein GLAREA_05684 [Glarea lozoyensis ATCC 20868]EPE36346.1 hypothetical protein GLAREA_05684 [Glarea lozoyensis ATCC 20868]
MYTQLLAGFLLAPLALAQSNTFAFPGNGEIPPLSPGMPFDITWTPSPNSESVNLILRQDQGDVNNLAIISIIGEELPNTGFYTYLPPPTLISGTGYAFQITDSDNETDTNYSPQFAITSPNTSMTESAADTTVTSPPIYVDPSAVTSVETSGVTGSATILDTSAIIDPIRTSTAEDTTVTSPPIFVDPSVVTSATSNVTSINTSGVTGSMTIMTSPVVIIDPIRTESSEGASVTSPPIIGNATVTTSRVSSSSAVATVTGNAATRVEGLGMMGAVLGAFGMVMVL